MLPTLMAIVGTMVGTGVVGCTNDLPDFNNPADPQNPESPFSQSLVATSGAGTVDSWPTMPISPPME
jgi:hypothetical protein